MDVGARCWMLGGGDGAMHSWHEQRLSVKPTALVTHGLLAVLI